jgi:hypothetical protein
MASRATSPQQLFFGAAAFTSTSPQHHGSAQPSPRNTGLDQFIAFGVDSDRGGSTPSCYDLTLSPRLENMSLGRSPIHHLQMDAGLDAPSDASSGEGMTPATTPRCSLDATQPFMATLPLVVLPSSASNRRQTAVFLDACAPIKMEAPLYRLREATVEDAEGIIELTSAMDMTNATSYVWPLENLRRRIAERNPLTIIAVSEGVTSTIAGCAGIDTAGMTSHLRVLSIGSRVSRCAMNQEYDIPSDYCMCRGLLIHPDHQSAGLGSRLHRYRIECLSRLYPHTPAVVLSARGSTIEEATSTLGPLLQQPRDHDTTPEFSKDVLFQFTFHTSQGVVHLAHHREKDGWKFVGVDVADGGPVWCTSLPLDEIVQRYPQSRRNTAVLLEPICMPHSG